MKDVAPISSARYRAISASGLLLALIALGGAVMIAQLPKVHFFEWLVFVIAAVVLALLCLFARHVYRANDGPGLRRIAKAVIAVAAFLLLQRVGWDFHGDQMRDASRSVMRPSLSFLPLLYIGGITLLEARRAIQLSWVLWVVALLITVPALWWYTGLSPQREGLTAVLVWLLLANPLVILMLSAQPHYQEQMESHAAELSQMRERTTLTDKLGESERRFTLVLQSLDVGVWEAWVGPPENRWWSPRFYELLGYAPADLPQTEEGFKALMHPEDRDTTWRKGLAQLRAKEIMDVDFRLKTHHRGYRWFNSRAKANYGADGRITRIAGALTDIHDQRLANDALRMAQGELTRFAYRDTLTDQYNRRYFDEHFQREWDRASRTREPLALLMIDLDHFKAYNDHFGHPVGDRCLAQVAQVLAKAASRSADIVARIGGEEFGVVLPGTSAGGAEEVAQRIRSQLREAAIPHPMSPAKVVTLSIGISSTYDDEGATTAELLDRADKALYEVKRSGRDSVMVYGTRPLTTTGEHAAG